MNVTVKNLQRGAVLLSRAVRGIFVATGYVRLSRIGDLYRCPVASGVAVLQQRLYSLRFDSLYIGERTRGDCGDLINGHFTVAYRGYGYLHCYGRYLHSTLFLIWPSILIITRIDARPLGVRRSC
jgi:hypothetical protein